MAMDIIATRVIFCGRVQGVGFRYTARDIASGLHLAGYVRNESDGTVEAVLQGPSDAIERCLTELQAEFGRGLRAINRFDHPVADGLDEFRITF
jgi:acylphosphatase